MEIKYLLDTDSCIYILNDSREKVVNRFNAMKMGEVGISVITYGELLTGATKSHAREKVMARLNAFTQLAPSVGLDESVAAYYADIRATLEKSGMSIGNNDMWIAAHACALDLTLVTNNEREFKRVPKLKVVNWT